MRVGLPPDGEFGSCQINTCPKADVTDQLPTIAVGTAVKLSPFDRHRRSRCVQISFPRTVLMIDEKKWRHRWPIAFTA